MSDTDTKLRILFVDDDARLLDGLRRAMHAYRTRWDTAFALGGPEALETLAREPVDIVITDMRMPGIDGASLLAEVALHYPHTVRLVLSGQTHVSAARRAMHVAHQFLAKPISVADLAATIERVANVHDFVADATIRHRVSACSLLPAAPARYCEVLDAWKNPSLSIAEATELLSRDPAMVAKLLQLAGSSFFGRSLRATNIRQIVSCLGLETLRSIILNGELASEPGEFAGIGDELADARQMHAWLVARIARRIAREMAPEPEFADDAYAAGILHDVGSLFLYASPEHRDAMYSRVGAYLLGIWGVPRKIVDAVADHRTPARATEAQVLAAVVHASDVLAHELAPRDMIGRFVVPVWDTPALDALGLRGSIAAWRSMAAEEDSRMGSVSA